MTTNQAHFLRMLRFVTVKRKIGIKCLILDVFKFGFVDPILSVLNLLLFLAALKKVLICLFLFSFII